MRVLHVGPGARGFVDFGVYGFAGDVKLAEDVLVDDNVGAEGKIELAKGCGVLGTVISTGSDVKLKQSTLVHEDVVARGKIDLESSASIVGQTYPYTAATPPLKIDFSVTPGRNDVNVKKGKSLDLSPGDYKKLKVEKSATLSLQSGVYRFEEFKIENGGLVELDSTSGGEPIIIEVSKKIEMQDAVQMVLIGNSEATDVLFLTTDSVKLGKQGTFVGTYLAPYGKNELAEDAFLTGALYAKSVDIKKRAKLNSVPAAELVISLFTV